jgi:cytoskeletal protein CcmA (bactofilin family)
MSRIDDTQNGELADLKKRIRKLETRSPLGNTSVSRGRTRFVGPESLQVEGSQRVTGQLYIDGLEVVDGQLRIAGSLVVSGNTDLTGPTSIRGRVDVTGPMNITGPTSIQSSTEVLGDLTIGGKLAIKGQTDISGATTVPGSLGITGDLHVQGDTEISGDTKLSGKLTVDDGGNILVAGQPNMLIGKLNNGQAGINFGTAVLYSDGARTALRAGSSLVGAEPSGAQCSYNGDGFRADSSGIWIAGLPAVPAGVFTYGVRADSNGKLYRTAEGTLTPGSGGGGPIEA